MTAKARTTTAPEPVPAGEPAPQPIETAPAPDPSPTPPPAPEDPAEDAAAYISVEEQLVDLRGRTRVNLLGQEVTWPLSVGEAIAEVTRRIDAIPKDRRATGGESYAFRGIDDALSTLHPLLGAVGLVILPGKVVREVWETRATRSGGTLNVARLLVRYTFVGPDGSELRAEAWGEAGDSGDKATQKAHSQSYKTLVFQAFSIPTESSAAEEPDLTNETARPFSAEEVQRAQRAWDTALHAPDLPALAGIRQRALHLLNVPLPMASGTVIPLSVLFDQQRGVLEGQASGDTGAGGSGGEQS